MLASAVDRVSPVSDDTALPLRLEFRSNHLITLKFFMMALPALAMAAAPIAVAALLAVQAPEAYMMLTDRPWSLGPLAAGFLLIAAFIAYCLNQLYHRLATRWHIEIDTDNVRIERQALFSTRSWSKPLGSYRGITRRARTSLSGTRHEIVLLPELGNAEILLGFDQAATPHLDKRYAALLDLPLIDPAEARRRPATPSIAAYTGYPTATPATVR